MKKNSLGLKIGVGVVGVVVLVGLVVLGGDGWELFTGSLSSRISTSSNEVNVAGLGLKTDSGRSMNLAAPAPTVKPVSTETKAEVAPPVYVTIINPEGNADPGYSFRVGKNDNRAKLKEFELLKFSLVNNAKPSFLKYLLLENATKKGSATEFVKNCLKQQLTEESCYTCKLVDQNGTLVAQAGVAERMFSIKNGFLMPANSVSTFRVLCDYDVMPATGASIWSKLVRIDIQQESDLFIFDTKGEKLKGVEGESINF